MPSFDACTTQNKSLDQHFFLLCPLFRMSIIRGSVVYPLDVCRVLEVIIEEQVEKLQATLRGIETLSVVARHTASKLTELISSEEVYPY